MRSTLPALLLALTWSSVAPAQGFLIPDDRTCPPMAMVRHRVEAVVEDQVAVTHVEQTFRNPSPRPQEAVYVFPVPRGAAVTEFAMWVDGKKVKGELVEAGKARQIYTDIVRRMLDPGLLEYMGSDLLRMRVFPVPARGEQKVELSYTALAKKDGDLIEYTYPLRTDDRATRSLEDFSLKLTLKSQQPIFNVYSPTHAVSVQRRGDHEVVVGFEQSQAPTDRSFQLFYTLGGKDVGLTTLTHRPGPGEDGYFLLLISPRPELPAEYRVPRDMVFVLDTSGSMKDDGKLDQAKKALKHCLGGLDPKDRFALITFATTVNRFRDGLVAADRSTIDEAIRWAEKAEALGGTSFNEALLAALDLQGKEAGRPVTVVVLTDGKPTMGETDPDKILANTCKKIEYQTRIFPFGVGHDLDAALLDQLAEQSRGVSTFVRPGEDLGVKVASFFEKISRPALTDLRLSVGKGVSVSEMYPPHLPDLFHGGQVVVAGRYQGAGDTTVTLTGRVNGSPREFTFPAHLPDRGGDRPFVEDIWARRKVGYLLEQIRLGGEKKELVEAVVTLAKRYGIATPYTSYLVVPDTPIPIVRPPRPPVPPWPRPLDPYILAPETAGGAPRKVAEVAREVQASAGDLAKNRARLEDERFARLPAEAKGDATVLALAAARDQKQASEAAYKAFVSGQHRKVQVDKLGVDFSARMNNLKTQAQTQQSAVRQVAGRNLVEIGGLWVDEGFDAKTPVVVVRAMSDAYFHILERQPRAAEAFKLGNHLVWVTPSGTALVIDANDGKEELTDAEIDKLFAR